MFACHMYIVLIQPVYNEEMLSCMISAADELVNNMQTFYSNKFSVMFLMKIIEMQSLSKSLNRMCVVFFKDLLKQELYTFNFYML